MSKGLLITLIAVGGLLLMCGGMIVAVMLMWTPMMQTIQPQLACTSHMTELNFALQKYAEKNGRAPSAESWQQELAPFVLTKEDVQTPFFEVPAIDFEAPLRCSPENPETGIAFNKNIAGRPWNDIAGNVATFFEWPEVEMNLSVPFKELPESASPKLMGTPRGWEVVTKSGPGRRAVPGGAEQETPSR